MTEASCQWQKLATTFPGGSVAEQWQSMQSLDSQFLDGSQKTYKLTSSDATNSTFSRVTRSSTSTVTVDFEQMIVRETQEKIRRLSTLERPQRLYQFEQLDVPSNWWDDFDCDCCELIRMAEEAGRTTFVLYIGFDNTGHEINLTRKTILNLATGEEGMIRQTPRATFSASSAAIVPAIQSLSLSSSSNVMTQSSVDESASVVISSSVEVVSFGSDDVCPICLEHFDPTKPEQKGFQLRECGPHFFHSACILKQLVRSGKCPVCSKHYIVATGNQPPGWYPHILTHVHTVPTTHIIHPFLTLSNPSPTNHYLSPSMPSSHSSHFVAGGTMNVVTYPPNGHYQLAGYPNVGTIFISYSSKLLHDIIIISSYSHLQSYTIFFVHKPVLSYPVPTTSTPLPPQSPLPLQIVPSGIQGPDHPRPGKRQSGVNDDDSVNHMTLYS